jgi:hypothetical protein
MEGHPHSVMAVAFSPDGKTLTSCGWDPTVRLWEVATGKECARYEGHRGWIASVAWSKEGKRIVSGGFDTTALVWDISGSMIQGRTQTEQLSKAQFDLLWNALEGSAAAKAYQDQWRMIDSSAPQTVTFLRERLRPFPNPDQRWISQLITDLDSEEFEARKRASAELEKLGDLAEPALCKALESNPSLETRKRLQTILETVVTQPPTGERLQALRALAVLEYIGSREARQLLEALAKGAPAARLTREAQGSLERLVARDAR